MRLPRGLAGGGRNGGHCLDRNDSTEVAATAVDAAVGVAACVIVGVTSIKDIPSATLLFLSLTSQLLELIKEQS